MRRLFTICGAISLLGASLILAACQTPDKGSLSDGSTVASAVSKVDDALASDGAQAAFGLGCGFIQVLDQNYKALVTKDPNKISKTAQKYIGLAEAALVPDSGAGSICTAPYPTSVATLVPKVVTAIFNMYLAYAAQGLDADATIASASTASTDTSAASSSSTAATTQ